MFHPTILSYATDLAGLFEPPAGTAAAAAAGDPEIARVACEVLAEARDARTRWARQSDVLSMMADEDWCLCDLHRRRARILLDHWRAADLPPGHARVAMRDGDILLVERCWAALQDELDDWRDFRAYRAERAAARGVDEADCHPSRRQWLAARARAWTHWRRAQATRPEAATPRAAPLRFRVG